MVKSGSFRPGKSGPSAPSGSKGRSGPSDKGTGTTHHPHPHVGNNRSPGTGTEGRAQWHPGEGGGHDDGR